MISGDLENLQNNSFIFLSRVSWVIEDEFKSVKRSLKRSNIERMEYENTSIIVDSISGQLSIALQNPNTTNTLTIDNIIGPDTGVIRCVGENIAGMREDETAIIVNGEWRSRILALLNFFSPSLF